MSVHTRERGSSPGFDGVEIKFYYLLLLLLLLRTVVDDEVSNEMK